MRAQPLSHASHPAPARWRTGDELADPPGCHAGRHFRLPVAVICQPVDEYKRPRNPAYDEIRVPRSWTPTSCQDLIRAMTAALDNWNGTGTWPPGGRLAGGCGSAAIWPSVFEPDVPLMRFERGNE